MSTPWISNVTSIADGEAVNQAVTNRALRQLTQRTQHLKELLSAAAPGTGKLTYSGAVLDSDVTSGSWVFRNDSSGIHSKALFVLEDVDGIAAPSASSIAVGIVTSAANVNDGTVLVAGACVTPTEVGVATWQSLCVSTETFSPGFYFLSDQEAGKMTKSAGASSIMLGWFGSDWARILPDYGDPLVQHRHDSFVIKNRPASYSRHAEILAPAGFTPDFTDGDWTCWYTNYWTTGEAPATVVPDPDGNVELSYYREVQLSVKFSSLSLPETPVRVSITPVNDPVDTLVIEVNEFTSGGSPDTVGTSVFTDTIALPAWGEWISVPSAGLSFALVSVSKDPARYETAIATALDDMGISSGSWYVIVDTTDATSSCYGWTNANPEDTPGDLTPRFRYIHEMDSALDDYYPSTAFENWVLALDGLIGHPDELKPYGSLLSWGVGEDGPLTTAVAPFMFDLPPEDSQNMQSLSWDIIEALWSTGVLYSANPLARGSQTLVSKLMSRCPALTVTGWNNTTPANRGELALNFTPVFSTATEGNEALSEWDPITGTFSTTSVVSRLRAGRSILVEKVDENGAALPDQSGSHVGPLKVSVSAESVGGEISLVALENAKESRYGPYTYIEFPPVAEGESSITARVTIPADLSGLEGTLGVSFSGLFFGEEDCSGTGNQAVFKVQAWIIGKGGSLEDAEVRTEAWLMEFPNPYAGRTVLDASLPVDGTTVSKVPDAVHSVSGVTGGDIVVIRIARVLNEDDFLVTNIAGGTVANGLGAETYTDGSIGMLSLSWNIYEIV